MNHIGRQSSIQAIGSALIWNTINVNKHGKFKIIS